MSAIDLQSNRFVQFMQMAVNNPSILANLNSLSPTDHAGVVEIARRAGFAISVEEVKAAVEQMQPIGKSDDELSEDDLDNVSGGTRNMIFL